LKQIISDNKFALQINQPHNDFILLYTILSKIMSLLSDEIFEQISSSTAENLQESRNILDKISRRKLPNCQSLWEKLV